MANLLVKDGADSSKYLKTSGAGTDEDAHVPEHLESNSADILTAAEAIQAAAETLDNIVSGSEAQVDIVTSALPTGAATSAKQDTAQTALDAIKTAVELLDNAIGGSEMQADIVAALPAGDNNIGNVDIASALPAGTNAIGKLAANSGVDIGDVDVTSVAIPTTIYNGQETVDAAGTPQAIGSSQAITTGVTVKALAGNTGLVYVGNSSVAAANGYELAAGEQVFVEVANVATVYVDAATNDDGVSWIAT